jgi:hypothetical protein
VEWARSCGATPSEIRVRAGSAGIGLSRKVVLDHHYPTVIGRFGLDSECVGTEG